MSQHHPTQNDYPLNANVVTLIFLVSFVVIGGLIYANSPTFSSQPGGEESVEVALIEFTTTPPPTATPTQSPSATPTVIPAVTSTQESPVQVAAANAGGISNSYDPALVAQGETLFLLCAACHGPDARGLPNLGKDLVESEFVHSSSDEELLTFVSTGRPLWDPLNTTGIDMPPKGGNPALKDEEILAIIAYVRSLSASGE